MSLNFPANPAAQTPINTYSPTSTPDATTNGATYIWTGKAWTGSVEGVGFSVTSSPTPPTDAKPNDLWFNTDNGKLYIYYKDVDSEQWVDTSADSASSLVIVSENPPDNPVQGELWWNSSTNGGVLYIYYVDEDSDQWVEVGGGGSSGGGDAGFWNRDAATNTLSPVNVGDNLDDIGQINASGKIISQSNVLAAGNVSASGDVLAVGNAEITGNVNCASTVGNFNVITKSESGSHGLFIGNPAGDGVKIKSNAWIDGTGEAKFAGSISSGDATSDANVYSYIEPGYIAVRNTNASAVAIWNGYPIGSGSTPSSTINSDGSATFAGLINAGSADFSGGTGGQDDAPGVKIYKNNANALYAPLYLEQGNTIGNLITGKNAFTGATTFVVGVDGDVIADGNVTAASANTGPLAGFRNQLINGNFQVWQRGEGIVTTDNVPEYTADRWNVRCAGSSQASIKVFSDNGSYPSTTTELPDGFSSGWETNYNGDGGTFKLCQGIELDETGKAGIFYQGTEWTLSVWANFDLTAELPYQAQFKDAVGYATSADIVTVIEQNWVSTGETSNGYTRYKATGTISGTPAASATSLTICIRFTSGYPAGQDSGRRVLTGAQFEAGPVATPYEVIPIQTQLANCQRYFFRYKIDYACVTMGNDAGRTTRMNHTFPTTMRIQPSVENLVKGTGTSTTQNGTVTDVDSQPSAVSPRSTSTFEINTLTTINNLATIRVMDGSVDFNAEL